MPVIEDHPPFRLSISARGLRSSSKATAITAQASQRPCLRARSGWCWFLTARPGSHDDGAIPSIRGGIEVALPIDDLAREAFATLSRGDLDWLQRQYLTQDIRCHFPGGTPRPGTYLRRWSSLTGPSSSQAAHSVLRCAMSSPTTSTPSRWPRSTADGPARRLERHGVFISHITDASRPRPGGRGDANSEPEATASS